MDPVLQFFGIFLLGGIGLMIIHARRRHVLETTPEADLIAEIKRRRTADRLAREVESEVDAEVAKL